uniref:Hepatocyte growth factor-regulated tyrosine kinase substrate n=2 Tax=Lutzomyia longipalpis TaxID=7200 RepID=A0A1B0CMJ4_LUTLO
MAIKKKMLSPNPHSAMYALILLESVVKNCGSPVHEEISSKANCEMFTNLIKDTPHENVKNKMLELIQCWAYAFRTSQKYRAIKDTMTILKSEGHTFPELKEADAMFTSDTAPDWADGDVCHRCRVAFSFTQRKHHCRNCGQVFCAQCSSKTSTLPKFGIEKEVRVCEACYMQQQQKPIGKPIAGRPSPVDSELPAEYLASSLAQQTQTPPRKTDQELQEEEELQLAIALSQSEAEHHTKVKTTINSSVRSYTKSPSPEAPMKQSLSPTDDPPSDPELSRYLNRNYWEQRQTTTESPASPLCPQVLCRTQLEIFVNRMKSNSSRGRSISNDSSVQTLFMNLTSFHSKLLGYIKVMDDKRMWYEQLQDKLAQVKDSRAALDVLRQEHQEKLRRMAEEMERQRQLQMAHKLEIMRKKKQEYLQYQRQLACSGQPGMDMSKGVAGPMGAPPLSQPQDQQIPPGGGAFPGMQPPPQQGQQPGIPPGMAPPGMPQPGPIMTQQHPSMIPSSAPPPHAQQMPPQAQQMPPQAQQLPPQAQQLPPQQPQQQQEPANAHGSPTNQPAPPPAPAKVEGQPGMDMSKGVAGPMGAPPMSQPQDQQIPPGGGAFPGMQPPPQQGQQPGMPPGMAPPGMPQPGPIMTQQHPSMIPSSAPPPHAQQMPPQRPTDAPTGPTVASTGSAATPTAATATTGASQCPWEPHESTSTSSGTCKGRSEHRRVNKL